jgi:hypothetical protein
MKSLWAVGALDRRDRDGLDGGPVMPDDYDGSPQSLAQVRLNVERSGEIGQLVAANYKSSIMLVPLQDKIAETGERIDYHRLSQRIEPCAPSTSRTRSPSTSPASPRWSAT